MKSYQTVEDFLLDESFRAWVAGDPEATTFWTAWCDQHPEQQTVLQQAKAIVSTLKQYPVDLPNEEVQQEIQLLVRKARERKHAAVSEPDELSTSSGSWFRWRTSWSVAASVLLIVGLSLAHRFFYDHSARPVVYRQLVKDVSVALLEKVNTSAQPLTLVLSDGSAITLEKGSRISYPNRFTGAFREVYLSGEAFFEVAHNPQKPFLVYANETVTKVLGTSFRIRALDNGPEVAVAVRTGKVSVYAKTAFRKDQSLAGKDINGVLLTPNQEVVFNRTTEHLQKGLVAKPELVATATHVQEMDVDDVPVTQVLQKLEKAYGIDMEYNEALLTQCPITAQFSDETLYDKLNFICQAIGASYEILDGQIIITSRGCSN